MPSIFLLIGPGLFFGTLLEGNSVSFGAVDGEVIDLHLGFGPQAVDPLLARPDTFLWERVGRSGLLVGSLDYD